MRIPALPLGGVPQPECPGEIEYARTAVGERRRDFRSQRVGQREEHGIRLGRQAIDVERLHRPVPDFRKRGQPL
jgi:hypothetical protein